MGACQSRPESEDEWRARRLTRRQARREARHKGKEVSNDADTDCARGAPPTLAVQSKSEGVGVSAAIHMRPVLPTKAFEAPPAELLTALVDAGKVVVCEVNGPYKLECYHTNTSGMHGGCLDKVTRQQWMKGNQMQMSSISRWTDLKMDEVDADWLLLLGSLGGMPMDLAALRKPLMERQTHMRMAYEKAFQRALAADNSGQLHRLMTDKDHFSEQSHRKVLRMRRELQCSNFCTLRCSQMKRHVCPPHLSACS